MRPCLIFRSRETTTTVYRSQQQGGSRPCFPSRERRILATATFIAPSSREAPAHVFRRGRGEYSRRPLFIAPSGREAPPSILRRGRGELLATTKVTSWGVNTPAMADVTLQPGDLRPIYFTSKGEEIFSRRQVEWREVPVKDKKWRL
jgi:hypothetical protein